jgi:hypothetical protein
MTLGGISPQGQLMRWIPDGDNRGAASMWKNVCFGPALQDYKNKADFEDAMKKDLAKQTVSTISVGKGKNAKTKTITQTKFSATVDWVPHFSITSFPQAPAGSDDGLRLNDCWPSAIAPQDPGFVLLSVDPWYIGKQRPYDYKKAYDPPNNGV